MLRYTTLTLLGLIAALACDAQRFCSHKVCLPETEAAPAFNEEDYRKRLFEKYRGEFENSKHLADFVEWNASGKKSLFNSVYLYRDWTEAESYLQGLMLRTLPERYHDKDLKIYLTRDVTINAAMLEDGTMLINAGLLAKVQNEAQLAAIMGHEYGHFRSMHSCKKYKALMKMNNVNNTVQDLGLLGLAVMVGTAKNTYGKLQQNELEADDFACQVFAERELPLSAVQSTFRMLQAEERKMRMAKGFRLPLIYFRTHPQSEQRIEEVRLHMRPAMREYPSFFHDSAAFVQVRKRAADECVFTAFEDRDYPACIESAFRQHLEFPEDEFYLFFLVESLRRQMIADPDFAEELFITGRYKVKPADVTIAPAHIAGSTKAMSNYRRSIFYHLQGPIFGMTEAQLQADNKLLRNDSLEFLTNEDAFRYFKKQRPGTSAAQQLSLKYRGEALPAARDTCNSALCSRYSAILDKISKEQSPRPEHPVAFYIGNTECWTRRGGSMNTLESGKDEQLRTAFAEYFSRKTGNLEIVSDPPMSYSARANVNGALTQLRKLTYRRGRATLTADQLRALDPELYAIAVQQQLSGFSLTDISYEYNRNKADLKRANKWRYVLFHIDLAHNRALAVKGSVKGNRKSSHNKLFAELVKRQEGFAQAKE